MVLGKRKLIAAAVAVAVVSIGGVAFLATQKPDGPPQSAEAGQRGPSGPGRGPGGPGGRGGGGPIEVGASPATPHEFSIKIEALGTLEPRERVVLTANAADRVIGVYFEDGQRVAKGKTLVTLVNEEERAQLASAQATFANARQVYERNQRLATNDAIAQLELERSKSASEAAQANVAAIEARLRDRIIVAPFSGVLGFRQVSNGAYVSPGQPVATLIDDSQMRLEFGVPSIYLSDLHVGLPIEATTKDIVGRTFTGTLTSIDNAIDPISLAVKVRATLPNQDGALRAGTSMSAILSSKARTTLSIPEISIIAEGSKTFVFVADRSRQPAIAKKTEVTLGIRERGNVEVVAGLQSGDLIVTDGVLKLRPDAPIRVNVKVPGGGFEGDSEPKLAGGEGPSDKAGLRQ